MYLLELFSLDLNVLIKKSPLGTTSKDVSIFYMCEERFKNLLDEGYIEDIDDIDNYRPSTKLQENIIEFLGSLIRWIDMIEKEKKASKKKAIEN